MEASCKLIWWWDDFPYWAQKYHSRIKGTMGWGYLLSENLMGKDVGEIKGVKEIWVYGEIQRTNAHLNLWIIKSQSPLPILSYIPIWIDDFFQN